MGSRLLRLRRTLKRRRPEFVRYGWWRLEKFKNQWAWRKPKGNDNKMRLMIKGYPAIVKIGYRGPAEVRGLHPTGLRPIVVSSKRDLEGLDPEKHLVYIAGSVGTRKRLEILAKARELGLRVANEVG
jgi:large subunit ribosomal protein L32e